jgi:hypothetical protein
MQNTENCISDNFTISFRAKSFIVEVHLLLGDKNTVHCVR